MWETLRAGKGWHGEFSFPNKTGGRIWEHTSISPVRNAADQSTHFVVVIEDITGRKQAEAALHQAHDDLRRANAELAQISKLKDEFLANMSHELRSPDSTHWSRSVAASLALPSMSVSVAAEARPVSIPCAPEALEWVLFELLENAKKFHPRGTPTVRVATTLDAAGGVRLTVSDCSPTCRCSCSAAGRWPLRCAG